MEEQTYSLVYNIMLFAYSCTSSQLLDGMVNPNLTIVILLHFRWNKSDVRDGYKFVTIVLLQVFQWYSLVINMRKTESYCPSSPAS